MTSQDYKRPDEDFERLKHALMNPLTVVAGYAQMIASQPELDPETRSRASMILAQATECVRIIETWKHSTAPRETALPLTSVEDAPRGLGRGRILVVDDEAILRALASQVLQITHEVETCKTAEEALELITLGDFDAILIDLNLRGPTRGRDLYETLKTHHPEVADRVVFMSGGTFNEEEVLFLERSGRPYIQKPFNIDDLRSLVQTVVDRSAHLR